MSSDIAIKVENLSKCYQIYDKPRDRLLQMFSRGRKQYFREFWALKDTSFEINKGETVGIIGRNGSGKSTLLQLICGTLNQTAGTIKVNGRIAALLELGSGFNPEFTGRENVKLSASLYGLTQVEIEACFGEIEAFAEIGEFIDQPVKTYSSGMYVRLAFAVSINVHPDILIVDEALAVGDAAFQAKCMARLKVLMNAGTTVLFVSHDTASIRNLCQRVLWLNRGDMVAYGEPEPVLGKYVAEMHLATNTGLSQLRESTSTKDEANDFGQEMDNLARLDDYCSFAEGWRRYGDGRATIANVQLLNSQYLPAETLYLREEFVIRILIRAKAWVENPAFGFSFRDLKGNQVTGSVTTNHKALTIPHLEAGNEYVVEIRGQNILSQGVYTLNLGVESVIEPNVAHEYVDVVENAIVFRSNFGCDPADIFPAMVWQDVKFSIPKTNVESI